MSAIKVKALERSTLLTFDDNQQLTIRSCRTTDEKMSEWGRQYELEFKGEFFREGEGKKLVITKIVDESFVDELRTARERLSRLFDSGGFRANTEYAASVGDDLELALFFGPNKEAGTSIRLSTPKGFADFKVLDASLPQKLERAFIN